MGQIATRPTFRILNSAEAAQQLEINNAYDNFDTACQQCSTNRIAAQHIQACAAPSWAPKAIDEILLPDWLAKQLGNKEIKIAFFTDGLPHTRAPDTIWLPSDPIFLQTFNETFIHELIHISQRFNPDLWSAAYKSVWNMESGWAPGSLPSDLKGRLRLNPDTFMSQPYTWTAPSGAKWTPALVFANPDKPRLTATRLLFVNAGGGWQTAVPTEWMQRFKTGEPSVCEHPHEMAAYQMAGNYFKNSELVRYFETTNRSVHE